MKKQILLIGILLILCLSGCSSRQNPAVLHIAMPFSDMVQDPDTNYYVNWLREQTGLSAEISLIRGTDGMDYLNELFSSDADIDIVLFGNGFSVSRKDLEPFMEKGLIDVSGEDPFYLNTGTSVPGNTGQILWINMEWLSKLQLSIPETTQDLKTVLTAFRDRDPNENGLADELPFAGTFEAYAFSPAEFILSSYVYNDPYHSRYGFGAEKENCLAATEEFRKGLSFCRELFDERLLILRGDKRELAELINSPVCLVGAFTAESISDMIYQGNPEILAKYIHVSPPAGPEGKQNAWYSFHEPEVGAVIVGRSTKKEEARLFLKTMLTKEASLIAGYGQQGTDWDFSDGTDVSIYGGPSGIVTRNYIWNTPQNKHLNGIGPMQIPEEYLTGVTWNGINSDAEYIDARAQMTCRKYLPESRDFHEPDPLLSSVIDEAVKDFVTGKREIGSDEEWNEYLQSLQECF